MEFFTFCELCLSPAIYQQNYSRSGCNSYRPYGYTYGMPKWCKELCTIQTYLTLDVNVHQDPEHRSHTMSVWALENEDELCSSKYKMHDIFQTWRCKRHVGVSHYTYDKWDTHIRKLCQRLERSGLTVNSVFYVLPFVLIKKFITLIVTFYIFLYFS